MGSSADLSVFVGVPWSWYSDPERCVLVVERNLLVCALLSFFSAFVNKMS